MKGDEKAPEGSWFDGGGTVIIHDRLRLETESRERQFNELERARKARSVSEGGVPLSQPRQRYNLMYIIIGYVHVELGINHNR